MTDTTAKPEPGHPAAIGSPPPPPRPRPRRPWAAALALLGAFLVGGGATALAVRRPTITLVSLAPAPINTMTADAAVALKGTVADVFGHAFVVDDGTGRALVDTGRAGDGGSLVKAAETVTVQGRFDNGVVRAAAITHADGRSDLLGPPGPPPPGGPRGLLATLDPRR